MKINRIGEINYNTHGSKMTIIEQIDRNNVKIKFENGYIIESLYNNFKNGYIKNPYDKTVFGIGFLGHGKYKANINKEQTIQDKYWRRLITRCYDKKYHQKQPTYIDVTCCEEWHNFQNFAKWFDENFYKIEGQRMCLDKDILVKGNKIYSPNTCVFVPQCINNLFLKREKCRGDLPIGVQYNGSKYRANVSYNDERSHYVLGGYNTPEEAFYKGYKPNKEQYIKDMADLYKDRIPKNLYNVLYTYEVEITD